MPLFQSAAERGLRVIMIAVLLAGGGARSQGPPAGRSLEASGTTSSRAARGPQHVSKSAVWNPTEAVLNVIRSECGPSQDGQCFVEGMQKHGASADAVTFARTLERTKSGVGYMKDFTEGGRVAVARVVFPWRANPNEAWLLVNGSPSPIDVDDLPLLPLGSVKADMIFQEIRRTFTRVAVFSDPRTQASPPLVPRPGNAQEFLVNDSLLDGCRTCRQVGAVQFAFDFTGDGKFEGVTMRGVWMTPDQGQLAPVAVGRDFHIHLVADHSAGYSWQLASPLNESLLALVDKTYSSREGQPGNTGVEDWVFHAQAPGRSIIRFKKVRPGEQNPPRDRRFFFVVTAR